MVEIKKTFQKKITLTITALTAILVLACFYLEIKFSRHGVLMLALVILGTGFDFSLSLIGDAIKSRKIVLLCTRISFSLLNFGVIFTAMSAAYVIKDFPGCDLSAAMISSRHVFLFLSIITGLFFLFTKYVPNEKAEDLYTLDKKDGFTLFAFIVRRIVLTCSLIMALIVVFEGMKTPFAFWSLMFGGLFIATVPLHILHKHILSMIVEFLTLAVLFYGTFMVVTA
jgi:hypothetical protein